PRELLADPLAHVLALEPGLDIARGLVGAPLVRRTGQADRLPCIGLGLVGELASTRLAGEAIALAPDQGLDHPVGEEVGIAPDRRREMRIGLVREAEVAGVLGRV